MNPGDHMIWSDYYLDYEDWRADLEAEYPELSEDQRVALMYTTQSRSSECCANLSIHLLLNVTQNN